MSTQGEQVAADELQPGIATPETATEPQHEPSQLRRALGIAAAGAVFGIAGAGAGLAAAVNTEAHLQVAGTPAQVETTAANYNDISLDNGALGIRIPASSRQKLLGQPVAARVNLDVDLRQFMDPASGKLNTTAITAYAGLFSDPKQITHDITWAVAKHDMEGAGLGLGVGLAVGGAWMAYRRQRGLHDAHHPEAAAVVHEHQAPVRAFQRRLAIALAVGGMVAMVPSAEAQPRPPAAIIAADPAFAGTPLEGAQLYGTLSPLVTYAENFVTREVNNTTKYYDQLLANTQEYLRQNPLMIPTGKNLRTFIFETDMHCNVGMGRTMVEVAHQLGIRTIAAGGDNAFSGSFSFEAGCTSGMAELAKKYKIDLVNAAGNHDSPMTMQFERQQGIHVLDGNTVMIDGVRYVSVRDPRTSRYGQGMLPASETAQNALLADQGLQIGQLACAANQPVIIVAHDAAAGQQALTNSCGNASLALSGHTHVQMGPEAEQLSPTEQTVYQFTGGSAGGAPTGEDASGANFFDNITVGPLMHNASFYTVTVDTETGKLVAVNSLTFTPKQEITVAQTYIAPDAIALLQPTPLASGGLVANGQPSANPSLRPSASPSALTKSR